MVNPTIYVLCIKQFWASVLIKKSNDAVKLQALIDRKKVIITEDTIRQALRLDDADGIDCLPNEEIFAELARMGYEKPSTKLTFYKAIFSAQWKFLIHTIVQCMSAKRTAWNEFSSSMASAIICLATGRKFNFLKYIFDSMVRNVDSPFKFLMYPRFLQVMINAQVDALSSNNTKYTSHALTQKVFANMRRIGKGFSGVETPLFDTMLVQPQVQDVSEVEEDEDANKESAAPTPPSPTPTTTPPPPQQEHIPLPSQAQPTYTSASLMTLLNKLMETCATLTQKVKKLEKKKRSKSSGLKRLRKVGTAQRVESSNDTVVDDHEDASKHGGKIAELDADEDVTLVDVDADIQGRMEEDVTAVKDINAAESEPTVFDDEEVTMTMAQTLIKIKAKKQRILDEQMAKRLQDEEIKQVAARGRQEKEDLERAKVLQQQYDQNQEDIDWNSVAEQMQEKHLNNVKKYQSLKRKPISVAQARKNMIVYLMNMAGYKIQHFKRMTYDQVQPIFEREYKHVQIFLKSDRDEEPTEKRPAKDTLLQEIFKKLRAEVEVSGSHSTQEETPTVDPTKISEKDVQNMLQIVPMVEFKVKALQVKVGGITQAFQSFEDMLKDFDRDDLDALWRITKENFKDTCKLCGSCILTVEYTKYLQQQEDEEPTKKRHAKDTLLQESFKRLRAEVEVSALQVKYPPIDWEIYSEGSRTYWRMIRVGEVTQAFQSFEYMLKDFDREDLDALWRITKEKFNTALPTQNKEKALWAELTRLSCIITVEYIKYIQQQEALELMLFKTSRKYANGLLLQAEELVLLVQINAVREK
nr:hypothetical protein [Tanacetum cinerariifolium]